MIKAKYKIYLIISIVFISLFTSCVKNNKTVDIYNIVKEAFLTDKGYSEDLSKHMSQEVFKRTNIYNVYNVNDPNYKKPFKVNFTLKEDSQKHNKNLFYVKMIYSVEIRDCENKLIGGSWDIPITFTVKETNNGWYIIDKHEPA